MAITPVTSDMTEKQAAFVSALLQGHSIPAAGEIAGYAHASGAYQAVRSGTVQAALREWRQKVVNTTGATLGLNTMIELCGNDQPAGVRFQAAKFLMLAGGAGKDEGEGEGEIGDMSEAQLEELVHRLEANKRAGGEPPVIRVRRPAGGSAGGSANGKQAALPGDCQ